MTDIVTLLRNLGWPLCHEGADEIERLKEVVTRLHGEKRSQKAEIEQLLVLVKELADDLEAELNGRYPQNIRDYPSMDARYERDIDSVRRARAALESKP